MWGYGTAFYHWATKLQGFFRGGEGLIPPLIVHVHVHVGGGEG